MPDINPVYIALIGTLFGGAGLKMVEAWLGKSRQRIDDAKVIRDELRAEVAALREMLQQNRAVEEQLESEIEEWRAKYYVQFVENARLQNELANAVAKIKEFSERARAEEELPPPVDGAV